MIKITYNRNNPLAYHEPEASDLLQKVNASRSSRSHSKDEQQPHFRNDPRRYSQISQPAFGNQEPRVISQFNNNRDSRDYRQRNETRFGDHNSNKKRLIGSDVQRPLRKYSQDNLQMALEEFSSDQFCNVSAVRQAYVRLWYEKLALQNSYQSLLAENNRKEQFIAQMRHEGEHKNGPQQGQGGFFSSQTPMNVGGQNKPGAFMGNQNNSQSIGQQGGNSHWGPASRNFNVTTTRSGI